jgi:hypothetical protein
MFDLVTERTDTITTGHTLADHANQACARDALLYQGGGDEPFRTINVLVIDTAGGFPVVGQCLRYMSRFECVVTHAGSAAAAQFALIAGAFDVVVCDAECLDIVAKSDIAKFPTIIVSERPVDVSRGARSVGVVYSLARDGLSPRLLETAISQVLRGEPALS